MNTELLALLIAKALIDWLGSRPLDGDVPKEKLDELDASWLAVKDKWKEAGVIDGKP